MNIVEHVNFDQLPTEAKCILMIAAVSANLSLRNTKRQSREALVSVARGFWNDSRLAPSDMSNLSRTSAQLCRSTQTTR
jgi:hypothetical protein